MNKNSQNKTKSYLDYLPEIYQQDVEKIPFICKFLKVFEKLLSGIDDDDAIGDYQVEGIEQVIDRIYEFFNPELTHYDFLKWLAGWVALSLRDNWDEISKRRLLKKIVPLYRKRGTKSGLTEYLKIFGYPNVSIDDFLGIKIDEMGTIGRDTFVGGLPSHYFIVTIEFFEITSLGFLQDTINGTKSIIGLEKPAYTYYSLRFIFPGIYIRRFDEEEKLIIGVNTIIGRNYPIFV